jgi:hypothetical protein
MATPQHIDACGTLLDEIRGAIVARYGAGFLQHNADRNGFSMTWMSKVNGNVILNIAIESTKGLVEFKFDKKAVIAVAHESDPAKMIVNLSTFNIIVFSNPRALDYTFGFNPFRRYLDDQYDARTMSRLVLNSLLAA